MPEPAPIVSDADGSAAGRPRTPLTGGQRASAVLAGLAGHVLFAIGWFGIAFVILGGMLSPLVHELLGNLLGDVDADRFTEILGRASALFWLLGIVFFVGSLAFAAFGVLASLLILRRGAVDRAGRVNWSAFVVAAVLDLPLFLLVFWLAAVITEGSPDLVWVPPVLAFLLAAAIGVVVWWAMAHLYRGPVPPRPTKAAKPAGDATGSPAPTPRTSEPGR